MRSAWARNTVWLAAIVAALVGAYVSHHLTLRHLNPSGGLASFLEDMCSATTTSSCEKVIQSEWGTFKLGLGANKIELPSAQLGTAFFLCTLTWLVLIGQVSTERWWAHLVFLVGVGLGLIGSLFFEWIMWTKLDAWCPLCLTTHVMNALLFVFGLLLWPRVTTEASPSASDAAPPASVSAATSEQPPPERAGLFAAPQPSASAPPRSLQIWPSDYALVVTPIVAVLAVVASHFQAHFVGANNRAAADANLERAKTCEEAYVRLQKRYVAWQFGFTEWSLNPQVYIDPAGRPAFGPADARHVVHIFSDFECPACKTFEEAVGHTLRTQGPNVGGIRIYFHHWPICQDCNGNARRNLHPLACKAAAAAEAAFLLGGDDVFWKMHDLLYARQDIWTRQQSPPFTSYARELGLDEQAFVKMMDSDEVKRRISRTIEQGFELGKAEGLDDGVRDWIKVNSTPAIFVNNKRLQAWRPPNTWQLILQQTQAKPLTSRPAPVPPTTAPSANGLPRAE